jgi:hypothetical protein
MASYNLDYSFTTEVMDHLEPYCNIWDFSKEDTSEVKHLVSYDKKRVNFEEDPKLIDTIGLLRSVVFLNNRLISFSPPKSLKYSNFCDKYPTIMDDIVIEEFIEGTMINVYYNRVSKEWEIATKNNIGANNYFYNEVTLSFRELFYSTCYHIGLCIKTALNKNYCYSFVFQHPYNYLVGISEFPKLYLIDVYEIEYTSEIDTVIHVKNRNEIAEQLSINYEIYTPTLMVGMKTYDDIIETMTNMNNYKEKMNTVRKNILMGWVIRNRITSERTKIRNPQYEYLHELRGNNPNFLYQYLYLRKQDQLQREEGQSDYKVSKINELLRYFPERNGEVSYYRSKLYAFTNNLFSWYIHVNVSKTVLLKDVPYCYKQHVYKLHGNYLLGKSSNVNIKITRKYVIDWVNNLPIHSLGHSLTHSLS